MGPRRNIETAAVLLALLTVGSATRLLTADPARLYPAETFLYVSTDDLDGLAAALEESQFGKLAHQDQMQPFIEDLRRVLRTSPLAGGPGSEPVNLDDLRAAAGGPVSLGLVPDPTGARPAGVLAALTVGDRRDAAQSLLDKLKANHRANKHRERSTDHAGQTLTVFTWTENQHSYTAGFCLTDEVLLASENAAVLTNAVGRLGGAGGLAHDETFTTTLGRASEPPLTGKARLQGFLRPIPLAEFLEAVEAGKPQAASAELRALKKHGFLGLRAVGGHAVLGTDDSAGRMRAFVWAPEPRQDALNLLAFRGEVAELPPDWVRAPLTHCGVAAWDIKTAFEHIGPLFDTLVGEGDEGLWDDIVQDIAQGRDGPMVDLRREFLPLFTRQIAWLGDSAPANERPEHVDRLVVGMQVTDERRLRGVLHRLMQGDPEYRSRVIAGHEVWEYVPDEPDTPRAALCAGRGHLLLATHVKLLETVLTDPPDAVAVTQQPDFRDMWQRLAGLAERDVALRGFLRLGEAPRALYDQLRGPEPPKLAVLDRFIGNQRPDFQKLPEYSHIRGALGTAGVVGTIVPDGWMLEGLLLD